MSELSASKGWIINPEDLWKTRWDGWIVAVLLFVAFTLPYNIAFHEKTTKTWLVIGLIIDISFLIDIVLTFFTAIYDYTNRQMVQDKRQIAKQYIKTWFFIDVISIFPFDLLLSERSGAVVGVAKFSRFARFTRMTRLIRVARMTKLFRMIKER